LRHELRLETAGRAHEEHVVSALRDLLAERERHRDVAARPAAGDRPSSAHDRRTSAAFLRATPIRVPTARKLTRSDVRPYDKNGIAMPFGGTLPTTTAAFSAAGTVSSAVMPAAIKNEKRSRDRTAIRQPAMSNAANAPSTNATPTSPSSSASTESTKSVCASGR